MFCDSAAAANRSTVIFFVMNDTGPWTGGPSPFGRLESGRRSYSGSMTDERQNLTAEGCCEDFPRLRIDAAVSRLREHAPWDSAERLGDLVFHITGKALHDPEGHRR